MAAEAEGSPGRTILTRRSGPAGANEYEAYLAAGALGAGALAAGVKSWPCLAADRLCALSESVEASCDAPLLALAACVA